MTELSKQDKYFIDRKYPGIDMSKDKLSSIGKLSTTLSQIISPDPSNPTFIKCPREILESTLWGYPVLHQRKVSVIWRNNYFEITFPTFSRDTKPTETTANLILDRDLALVSFYVGNQPIAGTHLEATFNEVMRLLAFFYHEIITGNADQDKEMENEVNRFLLLFSKKIKKDTLNLIDREGNGTPQSVIDRSNIFLN